MYNTVYKFDLKIVFIFLKKEANKMEKKRVVSIEDRIPKLKQMRKQKANRRLVIYLSIFFLLIAIIVYIQSPLSNVRNVVVTGNQTLSNEEIMQQSHLMTDTNIWTVKQEDIESQLSELALIETVEVDKKLPWTIHIHVTEHKVIGYVEKNREFYPILGNGTVLSTSGNSGDAPIMIDFSEDKYLSEMTRELELLPDSILNLISEIYWQPTPDNKNKIMLFMKDGFVVDGTIRNFSEKMQVYPSIVSQIDPQDKGIIHIGVGAYFEKFEKNNEDAD